MLPVLFSVGNFAVSSFGFMLALAFLLAVFLVWRLAKASDLDEEKVLDLSLLTFFGGLIGARAYFVLEHLDFFGASFPKIFQVVAYPGFSFWGGFLGGWISLFYFSRRFKLDPWQMADIAAVAFLGGLVIGDIGCLLGGCGAGIQSRFLGVEMVGLLGKRFPIQALEALLFLGVFLKQWSKATHFHIRGKIISLSLIYLGLIKFSTEFLRADKGSGFILSLALIMLGILTYYRAVNSSQRFNKRSLLSDLKGLGKFFLGILTEEKARQETMTILNKNWYNTKVGLSWKWKNFTNSIKNGGLKNRLLSLIKKVLRKINVKPTPKNYHGY